MFNDLIDLISREEGTPQFIPNPSESSTFNWSPCHPFQAPDFADEGLVLKKSDHARRFNVIKSRRFLFRFDHI